VTQLRSRTRAILAARGLRPRKARGQHFLVDVRVRDAIVAAAGVGPGDTVVEIGPGTGALTEALLRCGARVFGVELDRELAAALPEALGQPPGLTVWVADALRCDFGAHLRDHPACGRIRVVANIPYYITTPLILRLLGCRALFSTLHLTVQREVAERIGARPGTKAYGALTLACQYRADTRPVLAIPRSAFHPIPEVDSTLVRFDLLDAPRVSVSSPARLFRVIRAAFGQRRKTLRNALHGGGWSITALEAALDACGIAGQRRGETLTLKEFARLSEALPEPKTADSESDRDSDNDSQTGSQFDRCRILLSDIA
jgi:16S rRNA (adenine1518-N6/adenine1519-N6)-dimethyltransferase